MYNTKIIPTGMATRTKVPTLPKSVQLRQADLIAEFEAFYVEVTGNGLSEEYIAELKEKDLDDLLSLVNSRKLGFLEMNED